MPRRNATARAEPAGPPRFGGYAPREAVVLVAAAVDGASFGILSPLLPALRARVHATPLAASLLYSGYFAGMLLGFALGGQLVRRLGPKLPILLAVAAVGAGDVAIAWSTNAQLTAGARAVQGVGSGVIWMAAVTAAYAAPANAVGRRVGMLLSGYALGSLLGPGFGALGGVARPFLLHGCLEVLAFGLVLALLPAGFRQLHWGRLRTLARPDVLAVCGAAAVASIVLGVYEGSFPLRFGTALSQPRLAALFAIVSVCYAAGSYAAGRAATPARAWLAVRLGLIAGGGVTLTTAVVDASAAWYALAAGVGLSVGFAESATVAILGRSLGPHVVLALLAYSEIWALGGALGPAIGTGLAEAGGWPLAGWATLGLAVVFAGATAVLRLPVPEPELAQPGP